jgi:glycerophosphoryl diester phosphodiesterase
MALPGIECMLVVAFRNEGGRGRWTVHYNEGPGFRAVSARADAKSLVQLVRKHGLDGIDTSFTMPASLATAMRDAGLKLATWTVNEVADALELVECGVSDITTDRPAELRAALLRAGVTLA